MESLYPSVTLSWPLDLGAVGNTTGRRALAAKHPHLFVAYGIGKDLATQKSKLFSG
jgi:hypothetical protein